MKTFRLIAISSLLILTVAAVALAWHAKGHYRSSNLALAALPKEMPAFFRQGGPTIASDSLDNDSFTRPIAPPELHAAESCEHFCDVELFQATPCDMTLPLPATRYDFVDMCYAKQLRPNKIGLLPYAVTEWTQRLAVAFAEHRKWPDDRDIQAKCLVYAALLAHYAQDLCQPLHSTVHFDGRLRQDNTSPRSGIHNKVDALLGKVKADDAAILKDLDVQPLGLTAGNNAATAPAAQSQPSGKARPSDKASPLLEAVAAQLMKSHALVDQVYLMEKDLPGMDDAIKPGSDVEQFAVDRLRESTAFTASLYVTAWRMSEKIQLPDWHRSGLTQPK